MPPEVGAAAAHADNMGAGTNFRPCGPDDAKPQSCLLLPSQTLRSPRDKNGYNPNLK